MNAEILSVGTELGEVSLRATAKAKDRESAEEMMCPVISQVQKILGDVIYGIDEPSLEALTVRLLRERGLTISLAESCTGGLISKRITDIDGASAVYRGGVNVYTNEAKTTLLGISENFIEAHGVISAEVSAALAENVRRVLKSDIGIGVTGLAGPGDDGKNPVGTVFVALSCKEKNYVRALALGERSGRERIRAMAANHALDMVRRVLTGLAVEKI